MKLKDKWLTVKLNPLQQVLKMNKVNVAFCNEETYYYFLSFIEIREIPNHLTFLMLEKQNEIMTEEDKKHCEEKLYSESRRMMFKFQTLFSATVTSLKKRNITVKELSNHLKLLAGLEPIYKDSECGFLRNELMKVETVDDVMSLVSEYSSFFNYQMLQNIINNLGGEQDKRNLAKYLKDFAEYAKRTVFEGPCEVGRMNEEGHANMIVKVDKSYVSYTVNCLNDFSVELKKILDKSSNVMISLCRIEPGCLKLTFQMPLFLQQHIFPLSDDQEAALAKLDVIQLSCGDYMFTNEVDLRI